MKQNDKYDFGFIRNWIKDVEVSTEYDAARSLDLVAIVGVSGFFPNCMTVQSFWNHLDRDESLIKEIPRERFDWQLYYDPDRENENTIKTKWGGFIPDISSFDPGFFHLLPKDAADIDPRQRLLLMSTWQTLQDAGYDPVALKGSKTGVFIGCEQNEYSQLMRERKYLSKGFLNESDSMIANRISYFFGFSGPSEFVNTMCSGFAVALHRAVSDVREGKIERAIVGAANIMLLPESFMILSQADQLTSQRTVKSFGKGEDGYIRSEGVGTILIEKTSQAEKKHRHIYACIKHTAVNHNGQGGMSIAAPNSGAHTQLIKSCYQDAGIDPRQLTYIEAQGMGLPVADIAEWSAINRALHELHQEYGYSYKPGYCRVSTLKPMIGHMHAASSLAALLKIIRSFQTNKIHKILDFTEPNEYCDMQNMPCRVVTETESFESATHPRLAAFHSYGSGGNNAHVLIEEHLSAKRQRLTNYKFSPVMICLSAHTKKQLDIVIQNMCEYLQESPDIDLIDLSYTLNTGRANFDYRCAIITESIAELIELLSNYRYGNNTHRSYSGKCQRDEVIIDLAKHEHEKTLSIIAREWVNGAVLKNIESLYANKNLEILAGLPGYPFEKQSIWFQNKHSASDNDGVGNISSGTLSRNHMDKKHRQSNNINQIKETIIEILVDKLGVSKQQIEDEKDFLEYGIDSINTISFIRELNKKIERAVAPKIVYEYSNIAALSKVLSVKEHTVDSQNYAPIFEITIKEADFNYLISGKLDPTTMNPDELSIFPSDKVTFFEYVDKILEGFFFLYNLNKLDNHFKGHLIHNIYESGHFLLPNNKEISLYPWAIPYELGLDIYNFIVNQGLVQTLEIGLAYGLSTLFICEAHRTQRKGFHLAIDPNQEENFHNIAISNLEEEGLINYFEHLQFPDYVALPNLLEEGKKFDFIFIDGLHLFDYVLLDFFYADLLLQENGYIAFDDSLAPGVSPVLDFIRKNRAYQEITTSIKRLTIFQKLKSDLRFLSDPSGFINCFGKQVTPHIHDKNLVSLDHQKLIEAFAIKFNDLIRENRLIIEKPWSFILRLKGDNETSWLINLNNKNIEAFPTSTKFFNKERSEEMTLGKNLKGDDVKEKIAIVGFSARLPQSKTMNSFWSHLQNEKSLFCEMPKERHPMEQYYHTNRLNYNKIDLTKAGYIEDAYCFDSLFFEISPQEAELMDPHQRLLLEETYKCIEDAGYCASELAGTKTSVYVAIENNSFQENLRRINAEMDQSSITGSVNFTANRISYYFNFNGSSEMISAACASTSVAVCHAVSALQNRDCDVALVCAANLDLSPNAVLALSQLGIISKSKTCAPFDENVSGLMPGEGAGVMMLKRLSDAESQGDSIYCSIVGSGVGHGGNLSGSLLIPNALAQAALMKQVLGQAALKADEVDYIEAHGTGGVGDSIELEAIKDVFEKKGSNQKRIYIGSVKSYLGFSGAASGISQLAKVLSMIKHKKFVANLNFNKEPSSVSIQDTNLSIITDQKEWSPGKTDHGLSKPRIAAINSYGLGGSCAFLLLEEYQKLAQQNRVVTDNYTSFCFIISAKNEESLKSYAQQFAYYLRFYPEVDLSSLCYTFQVGRQMMDRRLAIVIKDKDSLIQSLLSFVNDKIISGATFWGTSVNHDSIKSNSIGSDEVSLKNLFRDKNYAELAKLWLNGVNIDWKQLYLDQNIHRLSGLPTYPFAREFHCFYNGQPKSKLTEAPSIKSQLSLQRLEDSFHSLEQQFKLTLTGDEFFLRDHQVEGQKVLPAAVYLEIVYEAIKQTVVLRSKEPHTIHFRNVVWIAPLVVGNAAIEIKITFQLDNKEPDEISYKIYTGSEIKGEKITVHSQGTVSLLSSFNSSFIDLANTQTRLNKKELHSKICYDAYNAVGIIYGPSHQGIDRIYVGENEALVKLVLPSSVVDTKDQFTLHPSLLDSCLQAIIGLNWPNNNERDLRDEQIRISLPFAFDHFEAIGCNQELMWAWLRCTKSTDPSDNFYKVDVDLCDKEGKIHMKIRGFSLRLLEKKLGTTDSQLETSLKDKAIRYFTKIIADTLKLKPEQIDQSRDLQHYGFNSILVIKFTDTLRKHFNDISTTLLFEVRTINGLVDYFIDTHNDILRNHLGLEVKSQSNYRTLLQQSEYQSLKKSTETNFSRTILEKSQQLQEIAIIGLSGRYPKADNMEEFWENLQAGKSCISEIPKDRWDWRDYFDDEIGKPGKIYSKWGGFLQEIDKFDPLFFQISPREAMQMDPQERLFLEEAYNCIQDAGYTPQTLCQLHKVGVFVGVMNGTYTSKPNYWSIANRVSYTFNFHGPSIVVDTACSSSLTAIHLALESIYSGTCQIAIAGGVSLIIRPIHYLGMSAMKMLSPTEKCKAFGDKADGFVDGEGVGAILLKPLKDAVRDRDHIYGVIKGSMINSGGKTNGYTVPNPIAQSELISNALERANVDARHISYIEAHGTGTSLGDPIEISGLTKAFRKYSQEKQFCKIGSVKSNIGHCESAAGIAGLTKVLLQLKYKKLVPSLHSLDLNPNIDFVNSPFVVQQNLAEWERRTLTENEHKKEYPRLAGISSFGAGGANAHVLIEEYSESEMLVSSDSKTLAYEHCFFVLSAKTKERLKIYAEKFLAYIKKNSPDLVELTYTLQVGREALDERLAIIAYSIQDLEEKLQNYIEEKDNIEDLYLGRTERDKGTVALLLADADVNHTIQKWVTNGKYNKFVNLWVKGFDFDWSKLYGDKPPKRISLPTYPFLREKYWLDSQPSVSETMQESRIQRTLISSSDKPTKIALSKLSESSSQPKRNEVVEEEKEDDTWQESPPLKISDNIAISANALQKELKISLAKALYMNESDIDVEKTFIDMGLDSIVGVEWIHTINKQYSLNIAATKIYDYPTINEFSEFLGGELNNHSEKLHPVVSQTLTSASEKIDEKNGNKHFLSKTELYGSLTESLAKALYMKQSELDIDKTFVDMGMDSIVGVEWVQSINKQYATNIIATKIYDYPTIRQFAQYLEWMLVEGSFEKKREICSAKN